MKSTLSISIAAMLLVTGCRMTTPAWRLQSPEEDRRMGEQVALEVQQQIGLVDNPGATTYVRALGNRLVANLPDQPFTFSFHIVDQFEPNAFAAPGGFVYISRSLLALANSEDELANVLGHEIIHVTRRHSAQQMAKSQLPGLLTLPGKAVGLISSRLESVINSPIESMGSVFISAHSRQHELESDELGQQLAARSGYDPASFASILRHLEQSVFLMTGVQRRPSFFDTHPTTPKRVDELNKRATTIPVATSPPIAASRAAFLKKLDGLVLGPNPAQGLFREASFLHPDLDLFLKFPEGWRTMNSPTAVGAVEPQGGAMIVLTGEGDGSNPQEPSQKLANELRRAYRMEPTRSEAVELGSWPAQLLVYTDRSGREPSSMYFLWVAIDNRIYRLTGLAPESRKEPLRATALSLRRLTAAERDSIRVVRIRLATGEEGESLASLSQRTGNVLKPEGTAVLNGLASDVRLREGQWVKIALAETYR